MEPGRRATALDQRSETRCRAHHDSPPRRGDSPKDRRSPAFLGRGPGAVAARACTILSLVGARPNFMKLAPLDRALQERRDIRHVTVHTGPHYDVVMSEAFFEDLGIPQPQYNLGVGSGSHAQQTATIMQRFEPIAMAERPDLVLVYGDVNSTVAAALVSAKLGLQVWPRGSGFAKRRLEHAGGNQSGRHGPSLAPAVHA